MAKLKKMVYVGEQPKPKKRGCLSNLLGAAIILCIVSYIVGTLSPSTTTQQRNITRTAQARSASEQRRPTQQAATQTPIQVSVILDDGLSLEIETIQLRNRTGNARSRNGSYLIVFGVLNNNSERSECVYARDAKLRVGTEEFTPDRGAMEATQDSLVSARDFIGPVNGQCVDANSSDPTFVVFDVPTFQSGATLLFLDQPHAIQVGETAIAANPSATTTLMVPVLMTNAAVRTEQAIENFQRISTSVTPTEIVAASVLPPTATITIPRTLVPTTTLTNIPATVTEAQLEDALATNDLIVSTDLVAILPVQGTSNRFLVTAELRVDLGRNNQATANVLREQIERLFQGSTIDQFAVILNDGSLAKEYVWNPNSNEWNVKRLQQISVSRLEPTQAPVEIWYTTANVNARSCAGRNCEVVTVIARGTRIEAIGQEQGESVNGNTLWLMVDADGETAYVHRSTVLDSPPPPENAPAPTNAPVQPQQPTQQQALSSPTPLLQSQPSLPPVIQQPPPAASACDCHSGDTLNCSNFSSHNAAQACYRQCMDTVGRDVHGLDGNDNDGQACESLP